MIFGLVVTKQRVDVTDRHGGRRIRCPKCAWEPSKDSRWYCSDDCGHSWNTFETGGVCPACSRQWLETACLHCGEWSAHDAWYAAD